jgi:hypothetical protein
LIGFTVFKICSIHVFLIHGPILQDTLYVRQWLSLIEGRPIPDWKRFVAVAANKQALIKLLGESIVQHYCLSSLEMSSREVPYLSGASNHCQENLQR